MLYFVNGSEKIYHKGTLFNSLRNIWEIADEMGPFVNISIVFLFGGLLYIFRKILKNRFFYLTNIISALIAVILVLAFLPENISRGYGIGLTGFRFDPKTFPIYLAGAAFGGTVYSLVNNQQIKKTK
jgi:hypothetical protein